MFPQGLRLRRGLYPHGSSGSAGEAVATAATLTLLVKSHSWSMYCGHALVQALNMYERFTAQNTGALTVPISQMKKLTRGNDLPGATHLSQRELRVPLSRWRSLEAPGRFSCSHKPNSARQQPANRPGRVLDNSPEMGGAGQSRGGIEARQRPP